MAQEVQIQGAASTAKIRGPVAVALLALVTLGIYGLVWYYRVNREMADVGRATGRGSELGDSPLTSLMAVTFGALIIVPAIVSVVHTFRRVQALQRLAGAVPPLNGWLALVLYLVFSPALWGYMQSGLNAGWERRGASGSLAGAPAVAEVPAPAAPR